MAQNRTVKKTRSSRTTQLQYTKMLDFLNLNKDLAEGKYSSLHGKEETQKKWTELAAKLNYVQGATKTAEQWQVVWRDLKSRTSVKVRDLRKAKGIIGNKFKQLAELSEIELRVIELIGLDIEGSKDCAENIPNEESLQNKPFCGNSTILVDTPQVTNVCNILPQENLQEDLLQIHTSNKNEVDFLDTDIYSQYDDHDLIFLGKASDNEIPVQQNLQNADSTHRNETHQTVETAVVSIDLEKQTKRKTPYILPASTPSDLPITTHSNLSPLLRRCSKANPIRQSTEQLYSREQFECIAKKQADAMMILAEASKAHAEAARMNALAMTEMAKAATKLAKNAELQSVNETDRIRVMEKVTEVLENLLSIYSYIH